MYLHPIQAIKKEVSRICSDILGEIFETAFRDASETMDEVCNSIQDILNLDSPGKV